MRNTVDELLSKPFGSLSYVEKLKVVKDGRPMPELKWEVQVSELSNWSSANILLCLRCRTSFFVFCIYWKWAHSYSHPAPYCVCSPYIHKNIGKSITLYHMGILYTKTKPPIQQCSVNLNKNTAVKIAHWVIICQWTRRYMQLVTAFQMEKNNAFYLKWFVKHSLVNWYHTNNCTVHIFFVFICAMNQ